MSITSLLEAMPQYAVLTSESKTLSELNVDIEWALVRVPLTSIELNQLNNRFAPEHALSEEEHRQAVINEDVTAFSNLKKSLKENPQFEQLIGTLNHQSKKIDLIAGHRRYFAAAASEKESVLIWVANNLSQEVIEYIRDWPEIHPTKVPHAKFAQFRAIYQELNGKSPEEKERRLKVWEKKGVSKRKALKAARTFDRMQKFCGENAISIEDRSGQMKAFEVYDQICEKQFRELQDSGDYELLSSLDKVAHAFLKKQIAHDDIKASVEGLLKLSPQDPIFTKIENDPEYLDSVDNLRAITSIARLQSSNRSVVNEVKDFSARLFHKLVDAGNFEEIRTCIHELEASLQRIRSLSNANRGDV